MQFPNLGHAHMCPFLSEITGLCVLSMSPWSVPLAEIENWMGSSLPHVWTTNETKPRLITALNISSTSWCNGNVFSLWWRLLQGYLQYQGQCFFKIVISRLGVFITLCILVVPGSLSGRPGFHHTRFYTSMVRKKGFCATDRGFLRRGYEFFSLLL